MMYKFDNFSNVKILVIGDVMVDRYLLGDVIRISPEAPVPVVRLKETRLVAGGAANVAANIAGLGATPYLIGVTGNDSEADLFREILAASNISADNLIKINNRKTTVKTRIIAHSQQIARVDQESVKNLATEDEETVWQMIEELIGQSQVIIISDYNKGLLSDNLVRRLITEANSQHKLVLVDPKGKDYSKYQKATVVTPNKFEVAEVCHLGETKDVDLGGKKLLADLRLKALLITKGEEGMTLLEPQKEPLHLKALARKVYDVTGAGDTVIATLAVAIAAGDNFREAAELANIAAGLVVEELGTTTIKIAKLKEWFNTIKSQS